ncbi:UNVERIFIED_CONTAM: hypothetical protein PYX00_011650 [Menopon gallinae]|uniref:Leucine-rich repeat protein soc-2 homolog n=1 Tax=Menopon gallinae TaxID=328185 RepID=A0AAW2H878_9NEOP
MVVRKMMCIAVLQWIHEVASASFCCRNKGHEEVPSVVFEARDLKNLDLSHNRLTTLPKEIESLSQLQELSLSHNQLTTLPGEIGNLSQLRRLYLNHNQLTTLPKEIESLSQLQGLSLCFNQLTELPGGIGSLSQLQNLSLGNNRLTTLPKEIESLSQLQGLSLYHNQLTELPGGIGSLSQLQNLSLGNNRLTTLPKEIESLSQLQGLSLYHNQLTELPGGIGSLSQLQKLRLYYNRLTTLPGEIGNLSQLQKLYLDNNQLTELPGEIGSLSQLKDLYIRNNRLITLPKEIGRLSHLQEFDLGNNQLTTLPGEIGSLSQLQVLDFGNNQLTTLPKEIENLLQLKWLNLSGNQLTALPREIASLTSIILLNLRNNPLEEHGEGDTLGWRELRYMLGGRVVLDRDKIRGLYKVVEEEEVYKRLTASSPHWNIDRLRGVVLESVPEIKHSAEEILDIWRKKLAQYAPVCIDGRDMESYIKTLWGIDKKEFKGWRMYDSSVPATRDLVEAVLVSLQDSPGQMAALNMVYGALYAKRDAGSFEYFVENEIATLKRYILDIVVTPGLGTQNVHVQNYWRYELREKLGFKGEYVPRMGTFDQDRFGGQVGNVLDVFYTKFTPKYVVERLAEEVNGRKERLMEAGAYLSGRLEDESYKRRVFEFASKEDADLLIPSRITHTGVEDILEGMGILERCVEDTSRKREQLHKHSFVAGMEREYILRPVNASGLVSYTVSFSSFLPHLLVGRECAPSDAKDLYAPGLCSGTLSTVISLSLLMDPRGAQQQLLVTALHLDRVARKHNPVSKHVSELSPCSASGLFVRFGTVICMRASTVRGSDVSRLDTRLCLTRLPGRRSPLEEGKHVVVKTELFQLYHASYARRKRHQLVAVQTKHVQLLLPDIFSGSDASWFPLSRSTSSCKETHTSTNRDTSSCC